MRKEPSIDPARERAARASSRDDDIPVLGDFSGEWDTRAGLVRPAEQPQRPAQKPAQKPARPPAGRPSRAAPAPRDDSLRLDPQDLRRRHAELARRRASRTSGTKFVIALVALAAVVVAFMTYEPLRTLGEQWLARARLVVSTGSSEPVATPPQPSEQDATPEIPEIPAAAGARSAVPPAPVAPAQRQAAPPPAPAAAADSRPEAPASEANAVEAPRESAAAPSAAEPSATAAAAPTITAPPATTAEPPTAAAAPAPPPAPAAVAPPPPSAPAAPPAPERFEFAASTVSVSEGAASARVQIRRTGGTLGESSIAWWTTEGSASAGGDYADLGATIERFAPGERTRTIHIPIVADSRPEGRESFYVNLGRSAASADARTPLQRIEIIVEDDD